MTEFVDVYGRLQTIKNFIPELRQSIYDYLQKPHFDKEHAISLINDLFQFISLVKEVSPDDMPNYEMFYNWSELQRITDIYIGTVVELMYDDYKTLFSNRVIVVGDDPENDFDLSDAIENTDDYHESIKFNLEIINDRLGFIENKIKTFMEHIKLMYDYNDILSAKPLVDKLLSFMDMTEILLNHSYIRGERYLSIHLKEINQNIGIIIDTMRKLNLQIPKNLNEFKQISDNILRKFNDAQLRNYNDKQVMDAVSDLHALLLDVIDELSELRSQLKNKFSGQAQ